MTWWVAESCVTFPLRPQEYPWAFGSAGSTINEVDIALYCSFWGTVSVFNSTHVYEPT